MGHVLHQAEPGDYDDKYIRWRPQDLPIVPTEWKLLITDSSRQQFETVKERLEKLISSSTRVTRIEKVSY